jgi:hypothetical protein
MVGRHDDPLPGERGCRNREAVGAPNSTGASCVREQERVGGGDRGDGHVVVVPDQLVQGQAPPLAGADDGGIEDQPASSW